MEELTDEQLAGIGMIGVANSVQNVYKPSLPVEWGSGQPPSPLAKTGESVRSGGVGER